MPRDVLYVLLYINNAHYWQRNNYINILYKWTSAGSLNLRSEVVGKQEPPTLVLPKQTSAGKQTSATQ